MAVSLWEGQKAQELVDAVNNRNMFSNAFKDALLNVCRHVAYTDGNGQDYYNALVAALGDATEQWDIDFNYRDGLLMDNGFYNNWPSAWSGTESYSADGIVLDTTNSGANGGLSMAPEMERSENNYNGGVFEIIFNISQMPATHADTSGNYAPNGRGLRISPIFGGSGVGALISVNENGIFYYNGSLAEYVNAISNIETNQLYKLRIECNESSSAVYLNNTLIASNVHYQTTNVPSKIQLISNGIVVIRDIKIKYN